MSSHQKVLAIDIGNSYTKLGCFLEGELEVSDCFSTEKENLGHYQEELQENLSQQPGIDFEGAVISSVVPEVKPFIQNLVCHVLNIPESQVLWIDREAYSRLNLESVDISYYQQNALGTDRLANVVAAHHRYPGQKVLVCDFGTTATFDLVDEVGVFLGGAICPGPVKFQSLLSSHHAAQLFEVDVFKKPQYTPGITTEESLANGLYYGYKGAVLEIVGNLLQQASWPLSQVTIVFTGGYCHQVREMLTLEMPTVHIDKGFTLKGLFALWQLNIQRVALKAER